MYYYSDGHVRGFVDSRHSLYHYLPADGAQPPFRRNLSICRVAYIRDIIVVIILLSGIQDK